MDNSAQMPEDALDPRQFLGDYLAEARDLLVRLQRTLEQLVQSPDNREHVQELFRAAHTLKSSASFLGFTRTTELAHALETPLVAVRAGTLDAQQFPFGLVLEALTTLRHLVEQCAAGHEPEVATDDLVEALKAAAQMAIESPPTRPPEHMPAPAASLISEPARVSPQALEELTALSSELAVTCRLLEQPAARSDGDLEEHIARLRRTAAELEAQIMSLRLVPVAELFMRAAAFLEELSSHLGKRARVLTEHRGIQMDRLVVQELHEPLLHLLRNALDHGLESTPEREAAGKNPRGLVRLSAAQEGTSIVLEVSDDGRGLDVDKILQEAVRRGLITEDEARHPQEAQLGRLLLRLSGFSTAPEVTAISGRGVGLETVSHAMRRLGGSLRVSTQAGSGTTFQLVVPSQLGLVACVVVRAGAGTYAVPLTSVGDIITEPKFERGSNGGAVLRRGTAEARVTTPLAFLQDAGAVPAELHGPVLLVADVSHRVQALMVDALLGTESPAVRPLPHVSAQLPGLAGAASLPQGDMALLLATRPVPASSPWRRLTAEDLEQAGPYDLEQQFTAEELRAASREAGENTTKETEDTLQAPVDRGTACLVLELDKYRFALPAATVRCVAAPSAACPLPAEAEPFVEVATVRGEPLPVLDLGLRLGLGRPGRGEHLSVMRGSRAAALRADRVDELVSLPLAALDPVPADYPAATEAVRGACRFEGETYLVIDPEELLRV